MSATHDLVARIEACPAGNDGWRDFEDLCIDVLSYLFVPPLAEPKLQARTLSGTQRRDAIFPNRNERSDDNWGQLYRELEARMILFEFKNFDKTDIGTYEVDQANNYLRKPMGRLAILVCNKTPDASAHIRRNTIFSEDKRVVLFITAEDLREMLYIKERGEDPSDLIVDKLEWFYIQHE